MEMEDALHFLPKDLIKQLANSHSKRSRSNEGASSGSCADSRKRAARDSTDPEALIGCHSYSRSGSEPHDMARMKRKRRIEDSTRPFSEGSIPPLTILSYEPPPLTLSAFRRPAVRLLKDCARWTDIEADYNLRPGGKGRILGHGASSTVRLACRRNDRTLAAVKCIPKHEVLRDQRRLDEFRLLRHISHPNIVKLYDVYETETDLFLVMEICKGGDLYSRIAETGKVKEDIAREIIFKIIEALAYLHQLNIVHRDVKPENILICDANDATDVKLTDFGLAKRMKEPADVEGANYSNNSRSRAYSRVGSDYYTAPEVNAAGGYDTAVDLYSVGVCAYILLYGRPPALASTEVMSFDDDLDDLSVSSHATSLVKSLLSFNPDDRPSAQLALKHQWFLESLEGKSRRLSTFIADAGTSNKESIPNNFGEKNEETSAEHSVTSNGMVLPVALGLSVLRRNGVSSDLAVQEIRPVSTSGNPFSTMQIARHVTPR